MRHSPRCLTAGPATSDPLSTHREDGADDEAQGRVEALDDAAAGGQADDQRNEHKHDGHPQRQPLVLRQQVRARTCERKEESEGAASEARWARAAAAARRPRGRAAQAPRARAASLTVVDVAAQLPHARVALLLAAHGADEVDGRDERDDCVAGAAWRGARGGVLARAWQRRPAHSCAAGAAARGTH